MTGWETKWGKKGVELTFAISIHLPKPSCHEKTSILGYRSISIPPKQKQDTRTRAVGQHSLWSGKVGMGLTSVYGLKAGLNFNFVFPVFAKNSCMNAKTRQSTLGENLNGNLHLRYDEDMKIPNGGE